MKIDWSIFLTVILALVAYKLLNKFLGLEAMIDKIGE